MPTTQDMEIDRNFDAFRALLPDIIEAHRGQHALMKNKEVIGFFGTSWEAFCEGKKKFGDEPFSVQEVTDQPVDLGFFSHVAGALHA